MAPANAANLHVLLVDQPGWPRDVVMSAIEGAGYRVEVIGPDGGLDAALVRDPLCVVMVGDGTLTPAQVASVERHTRPRVVTIARPEGNGRTLRARLEPGDPLGVVDAAGVARLIASLPVPEA